MMQTQMPYIFPVIIVWIASTLPSAFGLYLVTTTVFSIWQHWFISKREETKNQVSQVADAKNVNT